MLMADDMPRVFVRTLVFRVAQRVLGCVWAGTGPVPDAKDVEIAVLRRELPGCAGRSLGRGTRRPIG
jgi:hypothetical protein